MKKKKSEMYRNEIKSYIVRAGMTMSEVVDYLADEYTCTYGTHDFGISLCFFFLLVLP